MYAIVRSGGRQHKVAVGDVVEIDRVNKARVGDSVALTPLMVVDGESVTVEAKELAAVKVSAEVLGDKLGALLSA